MEQDIFEKVQKIVAESLNCEIGSIKMATSLRNDLGADSLDAVELNMALEEAFNVIIADEDLERFETISDIIEYLNIRKR